MAVRRWTAAIIGLFCGPLAAADKLPRLHALTDEWTVSGLSSGGYMASQIAVAHSRVVRGVGVFAGGPYYCVGIDPRRAEGECMKGAPDPAASRREAERLAALTLVDPVDNLKRTRSWVLAGAADPVVAEPVVHATSRFFAAYNGAGAVYAVQPGLGHGLPTSGFGVACGLSAPPFLNDCGAASVESMLAHLLPSVALVASAKGRLLIFDQNEFVPMLRRLWGTASLDAVGYVYVPEQCAGRRCRVHVALHGCRQGAAQVGDVFARHAGYNAWAEAHDLIVLYPQVRPSEPSFYAWWQPFNPRGCWDWWGYTGTDYATKSGVQIATVVAMVARLGQPR
ncbi:MAG: depolymerase [Burkholderiaceae bacterium]